MTPIHYPMVCKIMYITYGSLNHLIFISDSFYLCFQFLEELENVWPDYSCEQLRRQDCPSWARDLCKQSYQNCGSHNGENFLSLNDRNVAIFYQVNQLNNTSYLVAIS